MASQPSVNKKDYWDDKMKIKASPKEKIELLEYEIDIFRKTCLRLQGWDNIESQFEKNILTESLAIHSRVLTDFFYGKTNREKHPNDLKAQDLLPNVNWEKERPNLTPILEEAKNKAAMQLAHLSLWRIKVKRDGKKPWIFGKIEQDLEKVIKTFYKLLNR